MQWNGKVGKKRKRYGGTDCAAPEKDVPKLYTHGKSLFTVNSLKSLHEYKLLDL